MNSPAKRYVDRVLKRVIAPASRLERLRKDLENHFKEATERGESDAEAIQRLGPVEEVAASFMAESELRFAGFFPRFAAFAADFGLCLAMLLPFVAICAVLGPVAETGSRAASYLALCALAVLGISVLGIFVLYFPILEHLYGKTYGKHVMMLRVVSEEGAPISLGAAFIRRIPYFFELLWLDALFIPFKERKQRAFDIVAKTVVVHEPDKEPGLASLFLCFAPWLLIALVAGAAAFVVSF